ncbi:MAG: hypothetical protein KJZ85_04190 [Rhodobacteraceae bacterium]|jgi:hypothetical protein|nr:hypothetical protein [Paracoccaceae bacterium]
MTEAVPFWQGRIRHLALGGALTLALGAATAVLSARPAWQSVAPGDGLLRLSFTHSGARVCRDRTPEELAALPRNMRTAQLCERARSAVRVELDIDGVAVFSDDVSPSGLADSGPSRVYQRFELAAGAHRITLRMRDDPAADDFTQRAEFDVVLDPGKSIAVDFDATTGRFFIH